MKLTAAQKRNASHFYKTQFEFPNNISSMSFCWIESGNKPIEYSLVLDQDKTSDTDFSVSTLTIVGTISLVESDNYKSFVHLTGLDPNLNDITIWTSQIQGIFRMINSFPEVNGKTYECAQGTLSNQHVAFKLKHPHTLGEKQVFFSLIYSRYL